MSRRFRICMAKGGRESARPSYGRPKWTLISSQKKKPKTVSPKTFRPQFAYFSLEIESAVFWYIWNIADSISRLKYENCGRKVLGDTYLFLLATRISPASPNFGQAKQGQKFVVPTFHIHFLNPECVRIPLSPSPSSKSYFPPQCRPKSRISEETARVLRILVFQGDSSTRSAQADIHKRSKGIKRFLPETVGALGGMLGDGVHVESVQPRVRCCWSKAQGVNKPKTNLLERQSQKRLGADAQLR